MKTTPFYDEIKKLNAFMSDFGYWNMPIYISSIKDEHLAVRENVGMFDISHMAFFEINGENVSKFLNKLISSDLEKKQFGDALYSFLLNEDGGIIDDVIIYKKSDSIVYVIANAGNSQKVFDWFSAHNNIGFKIERKKRAAIAVQGPKSKEIIENINKQATELKYYKFLEENGILIARTGYTGEVGFEIYITDHQKAIEIWRNLLKNGVKPCGLGARDILRLEVGYPLYGHELNEHINPFEAGLKWAVDFKKDDFIGKTSLLDVTITQKLIGLELPDRRSIPRANTKIFKDKKNIGYVTSGSYSFYLEKTIAFAYIDKNFANIDDKVDVEIRDKKVEAKVVQKSFYYNEQMRG